MNTKLRCLLLYLFTFSYLIAIGQRGTEKIDKEKMASYRIQCEQMVKYLEETLNFLGDSATLPKERLIVINDSYLKCFRDENVQIEDDLISDRITVFYKPVQAYLRDINFFYKKVSFTYHIQNVEPFYNTKGALCFKATTNRTLKGSTIKGEKNENNSVRYIEIEYNSDREDLKIVSVYTTLLEESEDLATWWLGLSTFWREFFAKETILSGGVRMSDIATFTDSTISFPMNNYLLESVKEHHVFFSDVAGNDSAAYQLFVPQKKKGKGKKPEPTSVPDTLITIVYPGKILQPLISKIIKQTELKLDNIKGITDLSPIAKMSGLMNISLKNTDITNLKELRNLNKLEVLNIAQTNITDLSPIGFLTNLKEIELRESTVIDISTLSDNLGLTSVNLNNTNISNINPVAVLPILSGLYLDYTKISDLNALENTTGLQILSLNHTSIQDLTPLNKMSDLKQLSMDFSKANNLSPLSNLNNLTELSFNNTPVQSINPIGHLPKLQIIWCNNIVAPIDNILAFINDNPKTTVIFNTEEMETWWNILTPYWKEYFSGRIGFYGNPTERELSAITAINYIDISARKTVTDISCFNKIFMLKQLNASLSGITSLVSLANLPYLEKININFTDIQDVSPLDHLPRLDTLLANNTKIKNISALSKLPTLRLVECDNTGITDNEVKTVYNNNLYCLVVYKTESNINWWTTLSPEWKRNLTGDETTPDKYSLQKILNRKKIDIGDYRGIYNLYPVTSFFYLQKLIIRGSSVNDLAPISQIKTLTYLDLSNTPVLDITPIASLELIDTLRMENTQLKKYDVVGQLKNLKFLDVSGTQIKDLKPLSSLTLLEELVCNNTSVSTLKPLETLPELKRVKAFRTKISERTMKDFTTKKPYCEVIYY